MIQRPKTSGLQSAEQASVQASANHVDIDLSAITEEVIVAVSIGHEIKVPVKKGQTTRNGNVNLLHALDKSSTPVPEDPVRSVRPKSERRTSQFDHVTISIDISSSSDWKFCTEVGAWRRIVVS